VRTACNRHDDRGSCAGYSGSGARPSTSANDGVDMNPNPSGCAIASASRSDRHDCEIATASGKRQSRGGPAGANESGSGIANGSNGRAASSTKTASSGEKAKKLFQLHLR